MNDDRATPHFLWKELACKNRLRDARGLPIVFEGVPPGGIVAEYPQAWRQERGIPLAFEAERVRAELGGVEMTITSALRTPTYNAHPSVGGAPRSEHVEGRAIDIKQPLGVTWAAFYAAVMRALSQPECRIKGVGFYPPKKGRPVGWIHIDIRPAQRLETWTS
jgi:hypothetical protein